MMTRHELLAELHKLVRPAVYLEVGVFTGDSLRLAHDADVAIGIDPSPRAHPTGNQVIHAMTSDAFFMQHTPMIDMAFIDGMHLAEYALRDFINIELLSTMETVVVFDDVLPRNQDEASRIQPPGDWTGDVWRTAAFLDLHHRGASLLWVDTAPTGTAIMFNLHEPLRDAIGTDPHDLMAAEFPEGDPVPDWILHRRLVQTPKDALRIVEDFLRS